MIKQDNTPEIRFEEYDEDWEQRRFSDDIKLIGGATPSKSNKEYWNGSIVWLSSQEIKNNFVSEGTYKITSKAIEENKTKLIKAGTPLIVTRSGILAKRFPLSITTTEVAINQDIKALLFDRSKLNVEFIVFQIQARESFILKNIVKTGTTVQSVNVPDLHKMQINIPNIDEQSKVGKFFSVLNDTITLHQHELTLLKQRKKAFLQKMFPQKGKNTPEIRFSEYCEEWNQIKLDELLSYEQPSKYLVKSTEYKNTYSIPVLTAGKTFILGFTNESSGVYSKGDVILFDDFTTDFRLIDFPFKVKSSATKLLTLKRNNNLRFLFEAMKGIQYPTNEHKRYWISEFTSLKIFVPNSLEEQQKIGNFFKQLDEDIALHEQKLEKLKEMKKAFLQKMFV